MIDVVGISDAVQHLSHVHASQLWQNDPTDHYTHRDDLRREFSHAIQGIKEILDRRGAVVIDLRDSIRPDIALEELARSLGTPIRIFAAHPFWRPLGVDLSRPTDRSEGTGDQALHMDFVNATRPPRYLILYCDRPDPSGGGPTRIADLRRAVLDLSDEHKHALRRRIYHDGVVDRLLEVGKDENPFAVLDDNADWPFRYTGNLIRSASDARSRDALAALGLALAGSSQSIHLRHGQALVVDNRRMAHARGALGPRQELIQRSNRRLLYQAFIKVNEEL